MSNSTYTLASAVEKSTYIIHITFKDADGTEVVPNSFSWSLKNSSGRIVNGRLDVSASPATTVDVVLFGDDLSISEIGDKVVFFIGTAIYNSMAYGSNLPLRFVAKITIDELGL
jgi:hypothetical protein